MQALINNVNHECLPDGTQVTIPILADIDGNTALDIALTGETFSVNLASSILEGIQDYPFMHSGFVLVSAINKAFNEGVEQLGEFLDRRMVPSGHLLAKGLMRAGMLDEKI